MAKKYSECKEDRQKSTFVESTENDVDGKIADGPASIQTVADRAGVSIATVSRVLNGKAKKVSEETRARVLATVQELGYHPSRVGSALRSGRSRLVAVMVPDPANAYNDAIASAVEIELRLRGKVMVFCSTQEDPRIQDELLREMRAQLVSGIVMLGAVESKELSASLAADEPIVFVNRKVRQTPAGLFVGIDNRAAGRSVARSFVEKGFADAWVLHGPLTSSATRDRVEGFLEVLREQHPDHAITTIEIPRSRMDTAYDLANRYVSRDNFPRAIFCTTDEIAYGVYKHCRDLGLSVPADIHLFGFDGNPLNDYLAPWLSTIRVPYEEFGKSVVNVLERYWQNLGPASLDVILPFRKLERS